MNKWRVAYRIATEQDVGTFSIIVEISEEDDYWAVAKAMFPHAVVTDMSIVP